MSRPPRPSVRPRSLGPVLLAWVGLLAACTSAPDKGPDRTPADGTDGGDSTGTDGTDSGDTGVPVERGPNPHPLDDQLRWSDLQVLGSHNSTHVEPEVVIHPSHAYTHPPLDEQLEQYGVRAFELDLHLHATAGFQVFHLPGVDAETTCLQFADCLRTLSRWSRQHPWHLPIMVWIEPKDEDLDAAFDELLPFVDRHDELEQAILDVISRDRIFTPDDLRGDHPDLPTALATDGAPTLDRLRDRFIFSMLDSGAHRDAYLAESPVLAGRLMFANGEAADPWAAVVKVNDAAGAAERMATLTAGGFLVSSNIQDGPEHDEATGSAHLAATLAAGSQFLKVDRMAPVDGWSSAIPGGSPARCNPVTAPEVCTAAALESL